MRVAYLLPDPGIPVGGTKGASVHVAEVCRALAARGASVTLLAQRVTGRPPPGVELIHLDPGPLPAGRAGEQTRIDAGAEFAERAGPVLARLRPDLLYERLSLFFDRGGALADACGAARLVEVNAPVTAERERHFGLSLCAAGVRAERRALTGARVLAVSQPLAVWARQRGADHVEVVSNGVDAVRFDPRRCRVGADAVRHSLGPDNTEIIGFVGSLKPWHGVDVLLDAAALLAPRRPSLRVLVVGDGPRRAALEERAGAADLEGRVTFTGAIEPGAVPDHLTALDVATAPFLPSDEFYFSPLKVVEAMAAARPVVASSFAPIDAMLAGTGLLVRPGDAPALARAVGGLLDDPRAARRLGNAARRVAIRAHGWDQVASRILDAAGCCSPDRAAGAVR